MVMSKRAVREQGGERRLATVGLGWWWEVRSPTSAPWASAHRGASDGDRSRQPQTPRTPAGELPVGRISYPTCAEPEALSAGW